MRFSYQATDASGERIYQGYLEAKDLREARVKLREMGLYPLSLAPERGGRRRRPGVGDLVLFAEQFASLVGAGVPLTQALTTLSLESPHPTLRYAAREVRARIEAGESLSEAMSHYPEAFPPMMVRLIAAGELGGLLEPTLRRIARYLDRSYELEQKVKTALMYPAFVTLVVFAAVIVLLVVVVPVFARIYSTIGEELPLFTRALIEGATFLRRNGLYLLVGLAGAAYAFRAYYKTPAGAFTVDRWLLRLPLLGGILQKSGLARFGRTFAALYASGVHVLAGLEAARDLTGNAYMRAALEEVLEDVTKGQSLSQALAKHPDVFVPLFVRMVSVGEESGNLETMVEQAANHLEREVDYATKRLSAMIEPALTVVVGAMLLGMALALYLPLFELPAKLIRR